MASQKEFGIPPYFLWTNLSSIDVSSSKFWWKSAVNSFGPEFLLVRKLFIIASILLLVMAPHRLFISS